jgi:predicted phage terminase large subunit-like protein
MAGDKVTRAHAATPALAAGLVLIREGTKWAGAHVRETGVFPNGKRDDRVDAMTQVLNFYGETNDIAKARALLQM